MSERILHGDARETLKEVEEGTVHTTVTSPPYWGLRAYCDDPREIGREPTPEQHIANLVDVFREVRRVLRDDGVCFVNYGDAYSSGGLGGGADGSKQQTNQGSLLGSKQAPQGYKPKDLLSMPFRVVEALRNDGWYHRSTIIWSKRSPMPESVGGSRWQRCMVKTGAAKREHKGHERLQGGRSDNGKDFDSQAPSQPCPGCAKCQDSGGYVYRMNAGRPTTSHEYVFLLTKSDRYFYNLDGNRVANSRDWSKETRGPEYMTPEQGRNDGGKPKGTMNPAGRNLWTVWNDIKQSSFKGAHFATFPLQLAERCIKLGTSDAGCCPTCGNQWAPVVETDRQPTRLPDHNKRAQILKKRKLNNTGGKAPTSDKTTLGSIVGNADPERHETTATIKEWRATCNCENNEGGRPIVLDCFGGSLTTGEAAANCGCDSILCELNEEYIELGKKRFEQWLLI